MKQLLKWLFPSWNPADALEWEPKKEPKEPKKPAPKMENVVVNRGGIWGKTEVEDGAEWLKVSTTKEAKSTSELTKEERQEMTDKGWDVVKGMEIKRVWATGVGRDEAAKIIGKKGFSASSIKPYYTLFNSRAKVDN